MNSNSNVIRTNSRLRLYGELKVLRDDHSTGPNADSNTAKQIIAARMALRGFEHADTEDFLLELVRLRYNAEKQLKEFRGESDPSDGGELVKLIGFAGSISPEMPRASLKEGIRGPQLYSLWATGQVLLERGCIEDLPSQSVQEEIVEILDRVKEHLSGSCIPDEHRLYVLDRINEAIFVLRVPDLFGEIRIRKEVVSLTAHLVDAKKHEPKKGNPARRVEWDALISRYTACIKAIYVTVKTVKLTLPMLTESAKPVLKQLADSISP